MHTQTITLAPERSVDQSAADAIAELTRLLQEGRPVDLEAFIAEHSSCSERLRELASTVQVLFDLGASAVDANAGASRAAVPLSLIDSDDSAWPGEGAVSGGGETSPLNNRTLGDFRIIREIGRGGMGIVYEAEQLSLSRRVALKVLPFAAVLDPRHLQRFKNEALAAAHLAHPNIVDVYGVGCERSIHFYAMRLIEGQTLAAVIETMRLQGSGFGVQHANDDEGLKKNDELRSTKYKVRRNDDDAFCAEAPRGDENNVGGTLRVPSPHTECAVYTDTIAAALSTLRTEKPRDYYRRIAELGIEAAEALDHAHQMGIVHRDIKPSNLMLDQLGKLWITDFGLARNQADAGMTMTGDLLGTLRYMSPEQALAKRITVDHRTDIYSLGITVYELLALQPAFNGADREEVLRQIAFEEPTPLRRCKPSIPVELETIIHKSISKNPDDRYATARELAEDLARFRADQPISARPPTAWQRVNKLVRRHQAAAISALLALTLTTLGLAVSIMLISRERNDAIAARNEAEQERARAESNYLNARQAVDDMVARVTTNSDYVDAADVKLLEQALEFQKIFLNDRSTDQAVRNQTAQVYSRIAQMQLRLALFAKSEHVWSQAIQIDEQLCADFPENEKYPKRWAESLQWLALALKKQGRFQESETVARRGVAVLEKMAIDFPQQAHRYRVRQADSLLDLGFVIWADSGRRAEAETTMRQSLAILSTLVVESPDDFQARLHIAACFSALGWVSQQREENYRHGLAVLEKLVVDFPRSHESRAKLGIAQRDLALFLSDDATRFPEAESLFKKALATFEELAANPGSMPNLREIVPDINNHLGVLFARDHRPEEAKEAMRKSIQGYDKLIADFPNSPDVRYIVARKHNIDAWNLAASPDPEPGVGLHAVELARRATQLLPENEACWSTLGVALYRTGDWKGAVAMLDKSALLRKAGGSEMQRSLMDAPRLGADAFFLAMAHWQLDDKEAAHKWYREAVEWTNKNQAESERLLRLRGEAHELIGAPDLPSDADSKRSPPLTN